MGMCGMNIDITLVPDSFPFPHLIGHQTLTLLTIPRNGPKDADWLRLVPG